MERVEWLSAEEEGIGDRKGGELEE